MDAACSGPHEHRERISQWYNYPSSVDCIKLAILKHGPVGSMVVSGDGFQNYAGGVFTLNNPGGLFSLPNHMVVIVGWDDAQGVWIVRNSWGTCWGESWDGRTDGSCDPRARNYVERGYMRMKYGVSLIGRNPTAVQYLGSAPQQAALIGSALAPGM